MKWSRDHVPTWSYMTDLILAVDLDKRNVISNSGSVVAKKPLLFDNTFLSNNVCHVIIAVAPL
jgi:hypothetical protein